MENKVAVSKNESINKAYKTFRNSLRQLDIKQSLYVVWAYIRNIENNSPFPSNIEVNQLFLSNDDVIQKIRMISPWELEILAKEIIINSWLDLPCKKTLQNSNYFANTVNKLKNLEEEISKQYITTENINKELCFRISHKQFDWQMFKPNKINLARYFKIFNYPEVRKIIEEKTNLSTAKIFGIGLVLWSHFTNKFLNTGLNFNIPEINNNDVAIFKKIFSIEISELKKILRAENKINEKFGYTFHSLKRFPILSNNTTYLICPLPTYIFKQITSGLYYQVEWTGSNGNAIGNAFQNYVGEVLNTSNKNHKFVILPESKYGNPEKNTTDWIVLKDNSALFIECKTKRFTMTSKEELLEDKNTDKDLDHMADAVFQLYKTIRDYSNNFYQTLPFSEKLCIYPMVVTMEDWYLIGTSLDIIKNKVILMMKEEGIPLEWLDSMVYSICSINEFELISNLLNKVDISEFINKKQKNNELKQWAYYSYILSNYKDEIDKNMELFPDILKEILPISLKNM